MKKLNLQLGSIKEMLTKEQMKKVAGGYGGCDAGYYLCECFCLFQPGASGQFCVQDGLPCHTGSGPCADSPNC